MSNKRESNRQAILQALQDWEHSHGYFPSFRDIQGVTGISLGTVHSTCRILREDGLLFFYDGVARSLRSL